MLAGGVTEYGEGTGKSHSVFSDLKSDFSQAIGKLVEETWVAVFFCHPLLPLQACGWKSWGKRVLIVGLKSSSSLTDIKWRVIVFPEPDFREGI